MKSPAFILSLALGATALAQNVLVNGDFAKATPQENLWDGVDAQGFLAGNVRGTYALTESGKVGNLPLPGSVTFVDLNGDKLPDLVTADALGILRVYFNSGTQTEPKFTTAEVIPIYPPMVAKDVRYDRGTWTWGQSAPKLHVFDWNKRGTPDLIFGNYAGDVVMIPNRGTAAAPDFEQPSAYAKVRMPIAAKRPWGNLFAPCVIDWNKDGKNDLLIGEGSYSANAVYVLLNQSSGSDPKFTEDQRYYLCYGDGREQLVPTVADWNNDGLPDVLVGDRKGTISVHLNHAKWKPGEELPLSEFVTFNGQNTLNTQIAPHAADFNGDGLFDLLIAKVNGRIALALNTGTAGQPKFGTPVELKGTNLWADNIRTPSGWTLDAGNGLTGAYTGRGNLYAYFSVLDEASPGGGKVLRAGYSPSPNKVIKMQEHVIDGRDTDDYFHYWAEEWRPLEAPYAGLVRTANSFVMRQLLKPLEVGATYQLSFKTRGKGIRDGVCTVAFLGANENSAAKFVKTGRGVKADKDETKDEIHEAQTFTSNSAWKDVEKTFTVRFKEKNIKKLETTTLAILEFKFELIQQLGECDIADVQLVKKAK